MRILTVVAAASRLPRPLCRFSSPLASPSNAGKVDIPEVTRLATAIDRWRDAALANFRTGRVYSGPVEAVNGGIEQVDRGFLNIRHYTLHIRMQVKAAVTWEVHHPQDSDAAAGNQVPQTPAIIA